MNKEEVLKLKGTVCSNPGGGIYNVQLDNNIDKIIKCKLSGKMSMHHIRVLVGDTVMIDVSPYNLDIGRITKRL